MSYVDQISITNAIRKREMDAVPELKKRKRFRLWKIGKKGQIDDNTWWNITGLFISQLIFEHASPPVAGGITAEWINEELYYVESWVSSVTWKGTAYEQYDKLVHASRDGDVKAWKKLQKTADIITLYEVPTDPQQRVFYIQVAKSMAKEYFKRRRIVDNAYNVLRYMEYFDSYPTKDELPMK